MEREAVDDHLQRDLDREHRREENVERVQHLFQEKDPLKMKLQTVSANFSAHQIRKTLFERKTYIVFDNYEEEDGTDEVGNCG